MLNFKLNQEQLDALPEDVQSLYTESNGDFVLSIDIENHPDVAGLKNKTSQLLAEKKQLEDRFVETEKEQKRAEVERLEKANEWKTIAEQQSEEFSKKEAELTQKVEKLTAQIERLVVDQQAVQLAARLCGESSDLILPHVQDRLKAITGEDGDIQLGILDAAGNVSSMDIEALEADFRSNKKFHPVIKAPQSSGSGSRGGASHDGQPDHSDLKYYQQGADFSKTEQYRIASQDPELHNRLQAMARSQAEGRGGINVVKGRGNR